MNNYLSCEKCLKNGHRCQAHGDETLCIYCLDGVPCKNAGAAKQQKPGLPKEERLQCSFPDCDRRLNFNNKSGRCYTHFAKEPNEKPAERRRTAKRGSKPEPKPDIEVLKGFTEVPMPLEWQTKILQPLTLFVTEAHLNAHLLQMPTEKKLAIVQADILGKA